MDVAISPGKRRACLHFRSPISTSNPSCCPTYPFQRLPLRVPLLSTCSMNAVLFVSVRDSSSAGECSIRKRFNLMRKVELARSSLDRDVIAFHTSELSYGSIAQLRRKAAFVRPGRSTSRITTSCSPLSTACNSSLDTFFKTKKPCLLLLDDSGLSRHLSQQCYSFTK